MNKLLILPLTFVISLSWSQQLSHRLTNQDIIDMTALGLSDEVIITKIHSAAKPEDLAFDTSTAGLKALKAGKVSDEVIKVMINPAAATLPTPPAVAPVPAAVAPPPATMAPNAASTANVAGDPNLPPAEVGVYWKDGYSFQRVEGQIVSQAKVGGRAGSMFSYGMRSEHWDTYVNGPSSNNRVKERRPLFYLYVPDGASASDFILLKLEKKGNRREFQIGSFGGVTGGKSGVKRDKEIPFKADHVAVLGCPGEQHIDGNKRAFVVTEGTYHLGAERAKGAHSSDRTRSGKASCSTAVDDASRCRSSHRTGLRTDHR